MSENLVYIIGTFSEDKLLLEECCSLIVKSEQSDVVCIVLVNDEIVSIDLMNRLD